jgi:hypothetical protein
MISETYKLKKATEFILDVEVGRKERGITRKKSQESLKIMMEPGDFVGIDGGDVYIRLKDSKKWHLTLNWITELDKLIH